jgi:hypothetical protein
LEIARKPKGPPPDPPLQQSTKAIHGYRTAKTAD